MYSSLPRANHEGGLEGSLLIRAQEFSPDHPIADLYYHIFDNDVDRVVECCMNHTPEQAREKIEKIQTQPRRESNEVTTSTTTFPKSIITHMLLDVVTVPVNLGDARQSDKRGSGVIACTLHINLLQPC